MTLLAASGFRILTDRFYVYPTYTKRSTFRFMAFLCAQRSDGTHIHLQANITIRK
jgi:hypothetical protein